MKKTTKSLLLMLCFFLGLFCVALSIHYYTILYTSNVEFGTKYVLLNKYFVILGPAAIFSMGGLLIVGKIEVSERFPHLKSRLDPHMILTRIYLGLFFFFGILAVMFMVTISSGLPFDVTDWGITVQMFGKTFVIILPAILCGITMITLLIATSGNFWLMIFKIGVIIGYTALIYIGIVPRIMVFL